MGYIDNGAAIELSVEGVPAAGTYTLELGFFNGGGTASQTVSVTLRQGSNTLRFAAVAGGSAELDFVEVR